MHACPESVQGLHALRTGVHGQHACPAGPHAKPAVLTPFVGVRHAGIFCQTNICEVLTTGNVDSYLTASTVEGQPVLRTPLVLLQTYIDVQDHPFARDNLPRGYPDSTTAQLSLLTILRTLLKHEQGHLCSALLTNIVELNRRCIRDHVPNLANLIIKIRELLTTGNVDSYLTASTVEGQPVLRTPLVLLQTYIDAPDHPFAQDNLPRGYPDSTTAQLSLLTILQTLLKHEQGHLCSALLTNIVELNRRCIRDHVPNLANLIIKVDHMMYSSTHPQGPNGNNMAYNGTAKICIAFLQLSIAEFIFHPNRSSPLTSWEVIDRRLQHVKTKSCAFQYA
ncbi:hypothetical protein PCASD_19584 [Puccinia coronata f. sp. avenae]|uniref:Uncharacterized protein n=1 Tax=Puccinia coronata f. sp. avenae TaxID=200324 RepID=A0A2N5TSE2_9BASI|nr:hypothetical protein PCASD_19584 [Puccinia coronata f. sp. avenae]